LGTRGEVSYPPTREEIGGTKERVEDLLPLESEKREEMGGEPFRYIKAKFGRDLTSVDLSALMSMDCNLNYMVHASIYCTCASTITLLNMVHASMFCTSASTIKL
jgi:hypothetical protein